MQVSLSEAPWDDSVLVQNTHYTRQYDTRNPEHQLLVLALVHLRGSQYISYTEQDMGLWGHLLSLSVHRRYSHLG